MKNKKRIPSAVFQENSDKSNLVADMQHLGIGELIEQYAFAEAVVETVREPLVVLDKNLRVKFANKSFFDTFQLAKKDVFGQFIYDLNGGEWKIPELRKLLENILPNNSHFNDFEVRHNFTTIGRKIMLLNARRVILEENKTQLILLAIEDVTDKKELEEQKAEYMSLASHELKTPVTTIKAYAQLLGKRLIENGDKKNLYVLNHIHTQSDKITALINDFLDADKIEA